MHNHKPHDSRETSHGAKHNPEQVQPQIAQRLASSVKRIVRRVTRLGRASSALDKLILSESQRVVRSFRDGTQVDREMLVTIITNRICRTLSTLKDLDGLLEPSASADSQLRRAVPAPAAAVSVPPSRSRLRRAGNPDTIVARHLDTVALLG